MASKDQVERFVGKRSDRECQKLLEDLERAANGGETVSERKSRIKAQVEKVLKRSRMR